MIEPDALARSIVSELLGVLESAAKPSPEYVSPEEASVITGIPVRQLEALRSTRKGPPYFKLGGHKCSRVRYRVRDLRSWVEAGGPVV